MICDEKAEICPYQHMQHFSQALPFRSRPNFPKQLSSSEPLDLWDFGATKPTDVSRAISKSDRSRKRDQPAWTVDHVVRSFRGTSHVLLTPKPARRWRERLFPPSGYSQAKEQIWPRGGRVPNPQRIRRPTTGPIGNNLCDAKRTSFSMVSNRRLGPTATRS